MLPSSSNKNHDMDYQEYMNIINKVRKTKEFTRVRTEQIRLASMYAQEKKRQEEIKLEEQRLRTEREKIEKEREEAERRPSVVGVAARVGPSGASLTDSNRSSFQASDQKSNLSTQFAATVEHHKKAQFLCDGNMQIITDVFKLGFRWEITILSLEPQFAY